jgi:hypothetical protein
VTSGPTSDPTSGGTTAPLPALPQELQLEFCGEWHAIGPPGPFVIGREGDLVVDENPYLHRSFLALRWTEFWWIDNVGSTLTATISDAGGAMHSWLSPGGSLPLLFAVTEVRFTAGPTSYCLGLHLSNPAMSLAGTVLSNRGTTTLQPVTLTDNQRSVILALAEPSLLSGERVPSNIPSSNAAAARLGWTITKFNRQLDTVCQKLAKTGARGLHGGPDQLASNRRARLVEYALAIRLVGPEDLALMHITGTDDEGA